MCISVLLYVYHIHGVPREVRKGCQVLGAVVTSSCELLCVCWEQNKSTLNCIAIFPTLKYFYYIYLFICIIWFVCVCV